MIYTFYSYKGGVGRSMAMANIAQCFYTQGKRVIMIDWDLEAPGLEGYFFSNADRLSEIRTNLGLIDLLEEYKRLYAQINLEINKIRNEISGMTAQLLDELQQTDTDEAFIEQMLGKYALFETIHATELTKEISNLYKTSASAINVNDVAAIFKKRLKDQSLVNTLALNINNRIQQGNFDETSSGIYLSSYALLKQNSLSSITEELIHLKSDKQLNEAGIHRVLQKYFPPNKLEEIQATFIREHLNLKNYLQPVYSSASYENKESAGLWLISSGARQGQEMLTKYASKVQNFNWSEFYASYNGEAFFEWLRNELEVFASTIFIDSRTGISEMSGVSTRQLANKIVIITAPNPQNLTGAASMVRSFINEEVIKARKDRKLDVAIIPSRIDVSESALLNKFQATFYRTIDDILRNAPAKIFWELGVPYIPYYNYNDELAVGISDNPEELEKTARSPLLDKAYRKLASFLQNGSIEITEPQVKSLSHPYIGRRAFEAQESSLFFGRSHEIVRMLDLLSLRNLLIITGPPGSGKSSLINAGLIPALKDNTLNRIANSTIISFKTGVHPFSCLAEALVLESKISKTEELSKIKTLTNFFIAEPDAFAENIKLAAISGTVKRYVLIIDQFEEIFTITDNAEREKFINAITSWVAKKEVAAVLSVRSDYNKDLLEYNSVNEIAGEVTINLATPSERELRQIITEPAAKEGLKIEQGLTERILKDIATSSNKLLLLQSILIELWNNRNDNTLTHADYDRFGRAGGISKEMFESVYNQFSSAEYDAAMPVLTNLVNVLNDTRNTLRLSDIDKTKKNALKPFIDKGLLVVNTDGKSGEGTIELAHDILITNWPQLNDRIAKDNEFLAWKQQMNVKFELWQNHNKQEDFLLRKTESSEAKTWLQKRESDLSNPEKEFIKKSVDNLKNQKSKKVGYIVTGILVLGFLLYNILSIKTAQKNPQLIISLDSARAYADFIAMYTKATDPYDLSFNLNALKKYYLLDKQEQDTLRYIRTKIENTISYKFNDTLYSFYEAVRKNSDRLDNFLGDTITWADKQYTKKSFVSWINRLAGYKLKNDLIDSTFLLSSDSAGLIATYIETGNVILDNNLKEYKSFRTADTTRFDYNIKIKSFSYRIIDSVPQMPTVEIFVCVPRDKRVYRTVGNIINDLKSENKYIVLVRNNFVPSQDNSSPYYITSNQIRYNGLDELKIAKDIQNIIKQKEKTSFGLASSRIRTPNYISVFICGDTIE